MSYEKQADQRERGELFTGSSGDPSDLIILLIMGAGSILIVTGFLKVYRHSIVSTDTPRHA